MRATRYSLQFVTGAASTAATYGGDNYGDQTYGQRASDALEAMSYIPIPLDAGYPTAPSWIYRRGDTEPALRAQIRADEANPLDLMGVTRARLVLSPVDGYTTGQQVFPMVLEDKPKGIVRRDWVPGDLAFSRGTFNVGIVFDYTSGRRLTIPHDSRHQFVLTPQDVYVDGEANDVTSYGDGEYGTRTYGRPI